jgi:hypothetical protein
MPYGLDGLADAAARRWLCVHEGESNRWACRYHGVPSLGLPGSGTAALIGDLMADGVFEPLSDIYVCRDPGPGGTAFVRTVNDELGLWGIRGCVWELRMPDGIKDLADLHVAAPGRFLSRLMGAIVAARRLTRPLDVFSEGERRRLLATLRADEDFRVSLLALLFRRSARRGTA